MFALVYVCKRHVFRENVHFAVGSGFLFRSLLLVYGLGLGLGLDLFGLIMQHCQV